MVKDFHAGPFDNETILKLEIFRGYIREWLPVFLSKRSFDSVSIFDFFAGPGRDCNGIDGSPLIIIDEINKFINNPLIPSDSNVEIKVLFNDKDKDKISSLQREIKPNNSISIKITNLSFEESFASQKTALASNSEAKLVILDQSGIKEITHDTFRELIGFPTLDFMFFISSFTLKRFISIKQVKQYFPDMSEDDVDKIPATDIHRFVCDYYRKLTPSEKEFYLIPFSIKKGSNIYGIIFGSSVLIGLEKFLKVCWDKDRVSGEANYDIDDDIVRNGKTLFPDMNISKKLDLFKKRLMNYLEAFKNNNEIYKFTLENGCLPKHAREMLKNIQKDGKLVVEPFDIKNGCFYLNWEYYRKNEIRAKFRIKR